jgi:hypothetical protein
MDIGIAPSGFPIKAHSVVNRLSRSRTSEDAYAPSLESVSWMIPTVTPVMAVYSLVGLDNDAPYFAFGLLLGAACYVVVDVRYTVGFAPLPS